MKLALLFLIIVFTFREQASLAQKPELIIPVGHSNTIKAIACSPNSEFVLTGSMDNTIILWDIKTQQKIKTFYGHTNRISDLSFHPSGKIFASSSFDKTIRIWDMENGKEIKLVQETNTVSALKFLKNGQSLITGTLDSVKIWDITTWKVRRQFSSKLYTNGNINISNNGQFLSIFNGIDNFFYSIRDLENNRIVIESNKDSLETKFVACSSISTDGRWVAVGLRNKLKIIDLISGKTSYTSYSGNITNVCFAEDSKKMAIYSEKIYNSNTKDKIVVFILEKNEWIFSTERLTKLEEINLSKVLNFTPDGKKIISGLRVGSQSSFLIWDYNINKFEKIPTIVHSNVRKQLINFNLIQESFAKVQFNKKYIEESRIVKLKNKFKILNQSLKHKQWWREFIIFENREKNIRVYIEQGWLKNVTKESDCIITNCLITDTKDSTLIKYLGLNTFEDEIDGIFLIKEDKFLVLEDKKIYSVIKTDSWNEISQIGGYSTYNKYDVSLENNLISLLYYTRRKFIIYSLPTGEEQFRFESSDRNYFINSVKILENKQKVLAVFSDNMMGIFNLKDKILEKKIKLPPLSFEVYGFLKNKENYVILTNFIDFMDSHENQYLIFDWENGNEICTIYPIDSTDWVITTQEGFFDFSSGASQKLYYVQGLETFDLEQLKERYWVPGLMQELLGYKKEGLPLTHYIEHIPLPPIIQLSIKNNNLILKAIKRDGGIGKISLFINNIEIKDDLRPNNNADSSKNELNFTIPLKNYNNYFNIEDKNILKVVAFEKLNEISTKGDTLWYYYNLNNSKSTQTEPMVVSTKPKIDAIQKKMSVYGIIIGANTLGLKYAVKDAEAMKQLLEKSAKSFIDTTKGKVQITLFSTNQVRKFQPYKENIVNYLKELSKVVKPQDLFFMYYSGHGKSYINKYNQNDFAMVLQGVNEATKLSRDELSSHALNLVLSSRNELTPLLNQIAAVKKVFIYDACESGKIAEDATFGLTLKGVVISKEKAFDNMYSRTGVYFLSSSAKDKSSYEHPVFEHGFLTYSLLKGVKNAEGLKYYGSEAYLDIPKWFSYALADAPKVAASVSKEQVPVFRTPSQTQGDFFIGIVSDSLRNNISLSNGNKIQLASFSFQDEKLEDKLKISSKINAMIREKPFLGTNFWFEEKPSEDSYFIKCTYTTENGKIILLPYLFKGDSNLKPLPKITVKENEMEILTDKLLKNIQHEIIKE